MPKAISAIVTVGNASSASLRTSQAITAGFGVLRKVSEMTLVSRKIKAPVLDWSSGFREWRPPDRGRCHSRSQGARRRRLPAHAPPREFHKLRARVPRHRRSIDVRGAPSGAPGREPLRCALRAGVRPCWKLLPSATPGAHLLDSEPAPDGKMADGVRPSETSAIPPTGQAPAATAI